MDRKIIRNYLNNLSSHFKITNIDLFWLLNRENGLIFVLFSVIVNVIFLDILNCWKDKTKDLTNRQTLTLF